MHGDASQVRARNAVCDVRTPLSSKMLACVVKSGRNGDFCEEEIIQLHL